MKHRVMPSLAKRPKRIGTADVKGALHGSVVLIAQTEVQLKPPAHPPIVLNVKPVIRSVEATAASEVHADILRTIRDQVSRIDVGVLTVVDLGAKRAQVLDIPAALE